METRTLGTAMISTQQTLTRQELDRARRYLEQAKTCMSGAIRNLSESQWRFKPRPDRSSIAEIAEHVILVQERVLGPLQEKLQEAPLVPAHPEYARVDDIIIYQIPNRLTTFPSPVGPAGDLDRSGALERLSANHNRFCKLLETTQGLRNRSLESPPLKAVSNGAYESMDGYQWILAAAAHTERHTKQVLEVMADPLFPA